MEKFMATKQTVSHVGKMHLPSGIKMGACIEDRYKLVARYFLFIFFQWFMRYELLSGKKVLIVK